MKEFKASAWRSWLMIGGCLVVGGLLAWDFTHFVSAYSYFRERASAGMEQLAQRKQPAEILVVLTGDSGRIARALDLLRARGSRELIISGAGRGVSLEDLVNQQGATLTNLQGIWSKIRLESQSSSTAENALRTQELIPKDFKGPLILITSDYHMSRSLKVFEKAFPDTELIPYAVLSNASGGNTLSFLWKTGAEYWKSLIYRASQMWADYKG